MSRTDMFERIKVPADAWELALDRTRGLAVDRLRWDSDLDNLVANAYCQGVADVGNNFHLIREMLEQERAKLADEYQGEGHA